MLPHRLHAAHLEAGLLEQRDGLADRAHVHVGRDVGLDERAAAGRVSPRDICWISSRPPGRSRPCSCAQNAGYCPAPTCSPISTVATASYGPSAMSR